MKALLFKHISNYHLQIDYLNANNYNSHNHSLLMKLLFGDIPYHISTIYNPLHGSNNKNRKNNPTRICYSAFYSRYLLFFVAKTHKSVTDVYIILYKIPIIQKNPRQLGDGYLSLLDVFVDPSVCVFFFVPCYTTIL